MTNADHHLKTILVVDDEESIAEVLTAVLEAEGYRVVTASNGSEGLECLGQHRPVLALIDVMMPILDGTGMLQAMKRDPEHSKIPVLMMSAAHGNNLPAPVPFMRKPFELDALLGTIGGLIGTP